MNRSISSLRRLFSSLRLVAALCIGLSFAALIQGAMDGPRWLLLAGIPATVLVLTILGDVAEPLRTDIAMSGLRSGGPRAFAPAVVNGVKTVDKRTGRPVLDGRSVESVFAFDLTVMPDELPAYRVQVIHPLDLQGLLHRSRAVVEYDPEQPWRVVIPGNPPREWLARANSVSPPAEVKERVGGFPAGFWTLVMGVALAAVLLVLVRLLG
ncbi:hypothetical protein GCM10010207_35240 [Streptomyces atratus]|uniref:hypothetical protein n=1 Tax=Streptomyces atratus TaxID=1893 RepID=UPI0016708D6B|nr:hypothetical protein [Streptomyces atratus]GGT32252.1 hypothetical protein GCM10010207_35240 [Streptomyces atratus]